jgi:hypothetical protein
LRVAAVGFNLALGGHVSNSYFEHIQRDLGNRRGKSVNGWK